MFLACVRGQTIPVNRSDPGLGEKSCIPPQNIHPSMAEEARLATHVALTIPSTEDNSHAHTTGSSRNTAEGAHNDSAPQIQNGHAAHTTEAGEDVKPEVYQQTVKAAQFPATPNVKTNAVVPEPIATYGGGNTVDSAGPGAMEGDLGSMRRQHSKLKPAQFTQRKYRVSEQAGEVHLTVTRTGKLDSRTKGMWPVIDLHVSTRDGRGSIMAIEGEHYGGVRSALTLDSDDQKKVFTIPIYEREEIEPLVEFFVELHDAISGELVDSTTVLISDMDSKFQVALSRITNHIAFDVVVISLYTAAMLGPNLQFIFVDRKYDVWFQYAYTALSALFLVDMLVSLLLHRMNYIMSSLALLDLCAQLGVLVLCDWFVEVTLGRYTFTGAGYTMVSEIRFVWGHIMRCMKVGLVIGNATNGIVMTLYKYQSEKEQRKKRRTAKKSDKIGKSESLHELTASMSYDVKSEKSLSGTFTSDRVKSLTRPQDSKGVAKPGLDANSLGEHRPHLSKHNIQLVTSITAKIVLMAGLLLVISNGIYMITRHMDQKHSLRATAHAYRTYGSNSSTFYQMTAVLVWEGDHMSDNFEDATVYDKQAGHYVPKTNELVYFSVWGNVQLPYTKNVIFPDAYYNALNTKDIQELPYNTVMSAPLKLGGKLDELRIPLEISFAGFHYNEAKQKYVLCERPYTTKLRTLLSSSCETMVVLDHSEQTRTMAYANLKVLAAIASTIFAGLFMVLLDISGKLFVPLMRLHDMAIKVREAYEETAVPFSERYRKLVEERTDRIKKSGIPDAQTSPNVIDVQMIKREAAILENSYSPVLFADVFIDRYLKIVDAPLDALAIACTDLEKALGFPLATEANALRAMSTLLETKLPTLHALCVSIGDRSLTPIQFMSFLHLLQLSIPQPVKKTNEWKAFVEMYGNKELTLDKDILIGFRKLMRPAERAMFDALQTLSTVVMPTVEDEDPVSDATAVNALRIAKTMGPAKTKHISTNDVPVSLVNLSLGDLELQLCNAMRPHLSWAIMLMKGDNIKLSTSAEKLLDAGTLPELFFFLQVVIKHRVCLYARSHLNIEIDANEVDGMKELFKLLENRGVSKLVPRAEELGLVSAGIKTTTFAGLRDAVEEEAIEKMRSHIKTQFDVDVPKVKSLSKFRTELMDTLQNLSPTIRFSVHLTKRLVVLHSTILYSGSLGGPLAVASLLQDEILINESYECVKELLSYVGELGKDEAGRKPGDSFVVGALNETIQEIKDTVVAMLEAFRYAAARAVEARDAINSGAEQAERVLDEILKPLLTTIDTTCAALEVGERRIAVAAVEANEAMKQPLEAARRAMVTVITLFRHIHALASSKDARVPASQLGSFMQSLCNEQLLRLLPAGLLSKIDKVSLDALGLPSWSAIAEGMFNSHEEATKLFEILSAMVSGEYFSAMRAMLFNTIGVESLDFAELIGGESNTIKGGTHVSRLMLESSFGDQGIVAVIREKVQAYANSFGQILKAYTAIFVDRLSVDGPGALLTTTLTSLSPERIGTTTRTIVEKMSPELAWNAASQLATTLPLEAVASFAQAAIEYAKRAAPDIVPTIIRHANTSLEVGTSDLSALRSNFATMLAAIFAKLPSYGDARDAFEERITALSERIIKDPQRRQDIIADIVNAKDAPVDAMLRLLGHVEGDGKMLASTVSDFIRDLWSSVSESLEGRERIYSSLMQYLSQNRSTLLHATESAVKLVVDNLVANASVERLRMAAVDALANLPADTLTSSIARAAAFTRDLQPTELISELVEGLVSLHSEYAGQITPTAVLHKLNELSAALPSSEEARANIQIARATLEEAAQSAAKPLDALAVAAAKLQNDAAALALFFQALLHISRETSDSAKMWVSRALDVIIPGHVDMEPSKILAVLRTALPTRIDALALMSIDFNVLPEMLASAFRLLTSSADRNKILSAVSSALVRAFDPATRADILSHLTRKGGDVSEEETVVMDL